MNKYRPHLYIVPEDDAERQLVVGFVGHHGVNDSAVQSVPPVGGWLKARDALLVEYVPKLKQSTDCHVLLAIDADGNGADRSRELVALVPAEVAQRVFVLSCAKDPEALRSALGGRAYAAIGRELASQCDSGEGDLWEHQQLRHNGEELARLTAKVRPFLFGS